MLVPKLVSSQKSGWQPRGGVPAAQQVMDSHDMASVMANCARTSSAASTTTSNAATQNRRRAGREGGGCDNFKQAPGGRRSANDGRQHRLWRGWACISSWFTVWLFYPFLTQASENVTRKYSGARASGPLCACRRDEGLTYVKACLHRTPQSGPEARAP